MGIHTHIDPLDPDELAGDAAAAADELLAQVLSDYAKERFRAANEANRKVAGDYIAYTVEVDGRTYQGRGEVFPENQIAAFKPQPKSQRERQREANVEWGRKVREIVVEWIWAKASTRMLELAIRTLARARHGADRVEGISALGRILSGGEANSLLVYLVERWLSGKSQVFRGIQDARALYQVVSLINRAGDVLSGDQGDDVDTDVLAWIAAALRDRSPVLSGAYRDGHTLFADGVEAMTAAEVAAGAAVPPAEVYRFANDRPYSRKIEIGKTDDGRDFVVQVPNRIYERTADDAASRFPGVEITFAFEDGGDFAKIGSMPVIIVTFGG